MGILTIVGPDEQIRQGDVLRIEETFHRPFDCDCAVVMTADCDLVNNKHYGQILLCPIVTSASYFAHVWTVRKVSKLQLMIVDKIRKTLIGVGAFGDGAEPSLEVLATIAESSEIMSLSLQALPSIGAKQRQDLLRWADAYFASSQDKIDSIDRLVASISIRDQCSQSEALQKIVIEFKAELRQDSVDIVVLPDEMTTASAVCVVLLRCPFSVSIEQIGLTNDPAVTLPMTRAGCYMPQLKFLLAQKFGFLFSRIGVPGLIEIDRNAAIDLVEINL